MLSYIKFDLKNSLRTGFEPVRVTPSDFESDALTTRPSQLISNILSSNKKTHKIKSNIIQILFAANFLNQILYKTA